MADTERMTGLVLAVVLVAYNNGMNRWPAFHDRLYVAANALLTAAVLGAALGLLGLDRESLGLGPGQGAALLAGVAAGAAAAAPLFAALAGRRTTEAVADRRMAGIGGRELAWRMVVRVPFGTALCEEILFRGVLYAALATEGSRAALWSSAAFGLWHIAPTYNLLQANDAAGSRSRVAAKVGAGVLLTVGAGLFLAWLREVTGGIAAPFGFHAALNSLGTLAASLAERRSGRQP